MKNMKRTAIFLTATQVERLKKLQRETGAHMAETIRRALDLYLDKRDCKKAAEDKICGLEAASA
jgi:predicted DNA-binding protein